MESEDGSLCVDSRLPEHCYYHFYGYSSCVVQGVPPLNIMNVSYIVITYLRTTIQFPLRAAVLVSFLYVHSDMLYELNMVYGC